LNWPNYIITHFIATNLPNTPSFSSSLLGTTTLSAPNARLTALYPEDRNFNSLINGSHLSVNRAPGDCLFSLIRKARKLSHNPGFDRFSEIPSQDDHFIQLNSCNGPGMIVLADIPFLSKRVELLNNSILSSKSEL
jgi:hypothetical protein